MLRSLKGVLRREHLSCGRWGVHRSLQTSPCVLKMELRMPSLSPTMTEGKIVNWCKKEGDAISAGSSICEIQTDKAVVSMDADDDIVLAKILKDENSGSLKVGELIGIAAEDGEDWQSIASEGSSSSSSTSSSSSSSGTEDSVSGDFVSGKPIKMPSLSPTMTEGTIVEWKKNEGDTCAAGDVLCEIQTDKAVVAMEADDDVVLAKILIPAGTDGVKIGELIALTVEEGEDWENCKLPPETSGAKEESAPASKPSEEAKSAEISNDVSEAPHIEFLPHVGPATNLLIAQYGIDHDQLTASGPKGLIKEDVLNYISKNNLKPIRISEPPPSVPKKAVQTGSTAKIPPPPKPRSGYTDHPLSSMRAVIAKRLTESKQTSPHGYCTATCNIDTISQLRTHFKSGGVKLSVNDFIIKAVATTLQYVPEMNLNVKGEDCQVMPNIDISIAVATEAGLITPIVKDADKKSLQDISSSVKDLAGRARDNKLGLHEFQGGTFTISNLGMFGISEFTAIINPPQVGILAIGSGIPEVHPLTGKATTSMSATLSFDQRFIDDNVATTFMSTFKKVLENPEYMNLGLLPIGRVSIPSE